MRLNFFAQKLSSPPCKHKCHSTFLSGRELLRVAQVHSSSLKDKLPKVPLDAKNKLVLMGSGNNSASNGCDSKASAAAASEPPAKYESVDIDAERFARMLDAAKSTKQYEELQKLYTDMFKSPVAVCATFKVSPKQDGARSESPELKMDLVYLVLDSIKSLNVAAQKAVIRSVVNCLLDEGRGLLSKDRARCLFILLQVRT